MVFEYKGMKISFSESVYEPAEDTFLLLDVLEKEKWGGYEVVLEVGPGTGIVSAFISKKVKAVYALDINKSAALCTKKNALANGIKNVHVFAGDLFSAISPEKELDAIIFNTPYLPEDAVTGKFGDPAWSGGHDGRMVIERFLFGAEKFILPGGKIFLVESSMSGYKKTLEFLKTRGFGAKIAGMKKEQFEEIVAIKAEKICKS